jgi:excisionase family DNA binding protein
MKQVQYKSYDELPLMLSVPDVADVLGIGRANAYELVRSEGFPAIKIGNRIIVPKDEFISWIKRQTTEKSENFQ